MLFRYFGLVRLTTILSSEELTDRQDKPDIYIVSVEYFAKIQLTLSDLPRVCLYSVMLTKPQDTRQMPDLVLSVICLKMQASMQTMG